MSRLILIHGSFGNPDENWFPYLKAELATRFEIVAPQFPTGNDQTLDNWLEVFKNEIGELRENDILVGHSIGCAFILQLLSNKDSGKIQAALLVSGFLDILGIDEFDEVNKTFVTPEVDWSHIKNRIGEVKIWHGTNDPYVPITMAQKIATSLEVELVEVANGGHINSSAGFDQFPALKEQLLNI